jgi:hypothetical protein
MIVANSEIFLPAVCSCRLMHVASSEIFLLRICFAILFEKDFGRFCVLAAKGCLCYAMWIVSM